jgi:hypothetical protein
MTYLFFSPYHSILQPMYEDLIATFKLYYLQLVKRYHVSEYDGESKPIAQDG